MSAAAPGSGQAAELATLLFQQFVAWHNRGYAGPTPPMVKQAVRTRHAHPYGVWLDTRAGDGETTALLAAQARLVIAIEPDPDLFARARARFPEDCGVRLFQADPVDALPHLLPQVVGDLAVWIDRSRPLSDASKGGGSLLFELAEIARHRASLRSLCVMIDDVRDAAGSDPDSRGFPQVNLLVDWARANALDWRIEHDIFVARSTPA